MAPESTALAVKPEGDFTAKLNSEQVSSPHPQLAHSLTTVKQVLKASSALLKHIKSTVPPTDNTLISDETPLDTQPIWLQLTTKTHITPQKSLKPIKIALPHALNTSPTTTICLITADPQRLYKDLIIHPAFPTALSARITRVVGVKKLKAKWGQYEQQRKLFASHDIFLADDRIITSLPGILGKTFYKSTAKRPVPVSIQEPAPKTDGKRIKKAKGEASRGAGAPKVVAAELEKAVGAATVWLSASTNTAVRVGYASWTPEQIAENVEAVVQKLVEGGTVSKKWQGVKSVHLKGSETVSLPVWLAEELWVDEKDVLDAEAVKTIKEAQVDKKRKSRALEGGEVEGEGKVVKKSKKAKVVVESNDNKLDQDIAARKEKLKKQKADASAAVGDDELPKAAKKSKKEKSVVVEEAPKAVEKKVKKKKSKSAL